MKKQIILIIVILLLLLAMPVFGIGQINLPLSNRITHNYDVQHMLAILNMNQSNAINNDTSRIAINWANTSVEDISCALFVNGSQTCANFTSGTDVLTQANAIDNMFNPFNGFGFSYGGWFNETVHFGTDNNMLLVKAFENAGSRVYTQIAAGKNIGYRLGNSADQDCGVGIQTNTWNHIVITVNFTGYGSGNSACWINGTFVQSSTFITLNNFTTDWTLGGPTGGVDFDGIMADWFIINRTLTHQEIANISNGTFAAGQQINPASDIPPNFTMRNIVNLTAVVRFNITFTNNSNASMFFSTTTGNIVANLSSDQLYNLTINSLDHYNLYVTNYNVTDGEENNITVGQGLIILNVSKLITRTGMVNFTAINSNVTNSSDYDSSLNLLNLFVNTGQNTILLRGFNFSQDSHNYTHPTAVSNTTLTLNVTDTIFLFRARDSFNSTFLQNFNFSIRNDTYSFSRQIIVTNFNETVRLENMSFWANVSSDRYSYQNISFAGITNSTNITFSITLTNLVNLTVLYEQTRLPITNGSNITVVLIGELYAINQTRTPNSSVLNTSFVFLDVPSGSYEIRYVGHGFDERSKFIVIANTGHHTSDLYLLDEANSTEIGITVNDEFGNELEGAVVKALRYYLSLNQGIDVEHSKTNFLGQTTMNLEQDNVYYKFIIEKNGNLLFETSFTEITSITVTNGLTFQVTTGTDLIKPISDFTITQANITFINTTTPNFFRLTFNNPDGQSRETCLVVNRQSINGFLEYNNTCLTASAGTLSVNINESDLSVWQAVAFVRPVSSSELFPIGELSYLLNRDFTVFGLQGIFYTMMLMGTLAGIGSFNPVVGIIFAILGLLASIITNFIYGVWGITAVLIILCGVYFIRLRS